MKNLEVLTIENMKNIEGGNASVDMKWDYKDKDNCLEKAQELIDNGDVTGMSKLQIAQELYAHAIAFYDTDSLRHLLGDCKAFSTIMLHAGIVDIANGGDKWYMMTAYTAIWYGL